jgi:hypothetical protein
MIRATGAGGPILAALLLAACQTYSQPPMQVSTPMDGDWLSADGVFVATFQGGRFTSIARDTNAVLAQGTFRVEGASVTMSWYSGRTQRNNTATCNFAGENTVNCDQPGVTSFQLTRVT